MEAADNGLSDDVKKLLEQGANVNTKNEQG